MAEFKAIKPDLQQLRDSIAAANADGKVTWGESAKILADGAHLIEGLVRDTTGDQAAFDTLVADVESLVDSQEVHDFLRLRLGFFAEKFVSAGLHKEVRPTLEFIRARLS